jgi:uncharacterized damage-inducible protein DinB
MDYSDLPYADCPQGSEGELLLFALDRVHRQFAWKTGDLTAEQLRQQHPPSSLTLAGLIKHLTCVEGDWTADAHGLPRPLRDPDDNEWKSAVTDDPDELSARWYDAVTRCRRTWAETIANDELAATFAWRSEDYVVNRRRVLMDIIEENLLHTGQASVVREAIDGLVGNDPPSRS